MTDNSKYSRENPFDVPEGYFDMVEDRVEERIMAEESESTRGQKLIRMVMPILGLAASFALAFLLIYYPVTKILPKYTAGTTGQQSERTKLDEELLTDYGYLDENTFFLALTSKEEPADFESDEVLSFLTSELDDYEVYAEIIN